MSNKYQSNLRTFTARNLVWNSSASPVDLYTMNSPTNLIIKPNDIVDQFYRANWGMGVVAGSSVRDWNLASAINIKRVGMFSNFADGLVFENSITRLTLKTRIVKATLTSVKTSDVTFVQGSIFISGADLVSVYGAGSGLRGYISDNADIGLGHMYAVYDVVAGEDEEPDTARLSDIAYDDVSTTDTFKITLSSEQVSRTIRIPAYNQMYESEIFFNASLTAAEIAAGNVSIFLLSNFATEPAGDEMYFYTKTVSSLFNTLPVTVDSVIEAEVTPYAISGSVV